MHYIQFFTATILNWNYLLERNDFKELVIEALRHRVILKQVNVYGFVVMPNHMHIIWRIDPDIERDAFQRDFLKRISKGVMDMLKAEKNMKFLAIHTNMGAERVKHRHLFSTSF